MNHAWCEIPILVEDRSVKVVSRSGGSFNHEDGYARYLTPCASKQLGQAMGN